MICRWILSNLSKLLVFFFASQAVVERSFSEKKNFLVENLSKDSLIAQRYVFDHVKGLNFDLDINASMIQYVKNSSTKGDEHLKLRQEFMEEKESRKRKNYS